MNRIEGIKVVEQKSSGRGFASMDPEKRRELARKGGQNVPNEKRSFSQNSDLAAAAGRKGGIMTAPENRSFSINHKLAAEAGRKGGKAVRRPSTQADK